MADTSGCTLAVDIGERCGFAVGGRAFVLSGCLDLRGRRGTVDVAKLHSRLAEIGGATDLEAVVYTAAPATGICADLAGILIAWAAMNGVECEPCTGTAARKAFTGAGNASNDRLRHEAHRRGFNSATIEEAAALALLYRALCRTDPDAVAGAVWTLDARSPRAAISRRAEAVPARIRTITP